MSAEVFSFTIGIFFVIVTSVLFLTAVHGVHLCYNFQLLTVFFLTVQLTTV